MKLFALLILLYNILDIQTLNFDSKSEIFPSKEVCGFQNCEAFPWLVFIPLESRFYNPQSNLRCAGVLISKRYVLTHKSCLQFYLTKVHIGQFDSTKNVTCQDNPVLKIDVEEWISEESSEIVLLRLAEEVEFGDDVLPICLPFDGFQRAETGSEVLSSGWGSTSYQGRDATKMKKTRHTIITNKQCQKSGVLKDVKDHNIFCVKPNEDNFLFPCDGDEGSPIMYSDEGQWVLEGIITWLFDGIGKPCAIKNPAQGSRITEEVLEWIVEKVRP